MGGHAAGSARVGRRFRLDRFVPGIGRVRLSTSARTGTEHRRALALFEKLLREGRLDLIGALADGRLTWPELHDAHREGRLNDALALLVLRKPLRECIDVLWPLDTCTLTTRRYRVSLEKLVELLPAGATPELLRRVDWAALRAHYRTGSDWNHMRRAVSRLYTLLLHKQHPLRHETMARIPILPENERVPDVTLADLQRFLDASPEWLRPIILTLTGTGIRFGEFMAARLVGHELHCGTKTAASRRVIPIADALLPVVKRAIKERPSDVTIRRAWTSAREKAKLPDLRRHDCRHIAAQLLDTAGRPLTSIQATLGHSTIAQTAKYARKRLRREDSAVLAEQLGALLKKS